MLIITFNRSLMTRDYVGIVQGKMRERTNLGVLISIVSYFLSQLRVLLNN